MFKKIAEAYFSQFWRRGSLRSRWQHGQVLVKALFLVASKPVPTRYIFR